MTNVALVYRNWARRSTVSPNLYSAGGINTASMT